MQATNVRPSEAASSLGNGGASRNGGQRTPPAANKARSARAKATCDGMAQLDRGLIEALVNSKVFQEYERAFSEATGLPVALRPIESWQLPHHGKRNEGPFCAILSEKSRACA